MAVHSLPATEVEATPSTSPEVTPLSRVGSYFAWVPIHQMFTDSYGRQISERKVAALRANFNRDALGVILLSERPDGRMAILDGSHRRAATIQEGYDDMAALVYRGLSYQQEAALYLAFATVNRQQARDRFRARAEAADPDVVAIRAQLQRHGMDVALSGPSVGRVQAVYALDRIMQTQGEEFLGELVDLLYDAWGTQTRAWVSWTISGMAAFWARYRRDVRRDHLVDVLKLATPERVLAAARAHNEILSTASIHQRAYGMIVKDLYDRGLHEGSRLPEWTSQAPSQARAEADVQRGRAQSGELHWRTRQRLEREAAEKAASDAEWERVKAMGNGTAKTEVLEPPQMAAAAS